MARDKLSETKIKALNKPGIYGDGGGLFLRVRSGGSKQWFFIFTRNGKRTEIGLGGYGAGTAPVSLALAREKANVERDKLARGEYVDRRKTFAEVMADVLEVKRASFKNEKHKAQWQMTLTEYVKPLHKRPIATITIDDVADVLKPIWTSTPETADRTRMRIAAVFDYARARGLFNGDNPARWRGGLKELLPPRVKLSRGHHEAVPYADIPATFAKLSAAKGVSARAVQFACLTAARSGEVRGATWDEIDMAAKLWVVPANRMKAKREHRVPLSDAALAILKERKELSATSLVFEGDKTARPISDTAMRKALASACGSATATLHGLRSSFRDWCGDDTTHPRDVAEAALAHAVGNAVEQAYRRSDALAKRRALMNDWSDFCIGKTK